VTAGYSVYPTGHPWHRDAIVFGASGLPLSLSKQKPQRFEPPNCREANRAIVRLDLHESLGANKAKDLMVAIRKVIRHYNAP